MKRWSERKRVFGIVLATCLLAGCFIPIYYAYKAFETDKLVGIAVNIKRPAPEVYATAIQVIERNKRYEILKRDDERMVLSLQSIQNKELDATVTVSALTSRSSRYEVIGTKQKGVDPEVQKREALRTVLTVCSEFGYECTAEKPKK